MSEVAAHQPRCPVCGYEGAFNAHKRSGRPNATCPDCGGRERHRMLALFFRTEIGDVTGKHVLGVSPEGLLLPFLATASGYESADLEMEDVDHPNFDLTRSQLEAGRYDVILLNHVLEHIEDDARALQELYRLLAPGGIVEITVPVIEGWEKTFEDPLITSPEERSRYFGRHDHMRFYGRDIRDRIRAAGFELEIYQPTGRECVDHAITRGQSVFVARKPR